MNTDKLHGVQSLAAVQAAYTLVSAAQNYPPHEQVAGIAILFTTMCEQAGLDVSEMINKAQRMSKDADTYFTREIKALREYCKEELRK